jgi:methyl-accepting chemotaxis protein
MATTIGLGAQLTANAGGMTRGLSEAERALGKLQAQADRNKQTFREFSGVVSLLPGPLGQISGRLSSLTNASDGLQRLFSSQFAGGIGNLGTAIGGLANPFTLAAGAIIGFGAAAASISRGLQDLANRTESLSFAAKQAGVSFQEIQVLEGAANRTGQSVDALATGIQKFAARLNEAADGSGKTFEALQRLGFSLQEIQAGSNNPTQFAGQVAAALDQIENPAERAALQLEVLGRAGETVVRGFSGIAEATEQLKQFNGALSDADASRLLSLQTSFNGIKEALKGFGQELLTPFIGITQAITDGFAGAITGIGRTLGTLLDILSPVTSAVGLLANVFLQVTGAVFNLISAALKPVGDFLSGVAQGIDSISQGVSSLFGGFSSSFAAEAERTANAIESQRDRTEETVKAQEELAKRLKASADAAVAADKARADAFIKTQGLDIEAPAVAAAEDLAAIKRQILETEQAITAAQADGDRLAEQNAVRRLQLLDQAKAAASEVIEFGFSTTEANKLIEDLQADLERSFTFENITIAPDAFRQVRQEFEELQRLLSEGAIDPDTFKTAADQLKRGFADAVKEAEKLQALSIQYAQRVTEIDAERVRLLNQASNQPLQVQDVRTSQGASQLLAFGRVDEGLAEARRQTSELQRIRQAIAALEQGDQVDIVGN